MKKKLIILSVLAIVVAGALFFLGIIPGGSETEAVGLDEHGDPIVVSTDPVYLPLSPAFVVNFTHQGNLRYLQVELEVMYYDEDITDRVTAHMPAIRNALILLLSGQEFEKLSSLQGKEQLRREMITIINKLVLTEEELEADVTGEIYITNYIMQ